MKKLAPVVIPTYNRVDHLRQTVSALANNDLAKESILIIYIDGAKEGDEEIVQKNKDYCKSISGFKEVRIIERDKNYFPKSITMSMEEPLEEFEKIIWMEDDNVTAPGFLTFMNEALIFYKDDERIHSISGFILPFEIPNNYNKDIILSHGFSAYGFGIWKKNYDKVRRLSKDEFIRFKNTESFKQFKVRYNPIFSLLLEEDSFGLIDAFDVRVFYLMHVNNMYQVIPIKSLVRNTGFDGSGQNANKKKDYNFTELWNKTQFELEAGIKYNELYLDLIKEYIKKYRSYSLFKLFLMKIIRKLGLFDLFRKLYNKIN